MMPLSVQALAAAPQAAASAAPAAATGALTFHDGDWSQARDHGTREYRGDDYRWEHRHDDRADERRRHNDHWRRHDHWYRCGWGPDRDRYHHYRNRHSNWDWDCYLYWRR